MEVPLEWDGLDNDTSKISRDEESENVSLVVQGMLIKFECRFLKRMVWGISFEIWLCLNVVHSYSIHGNT